MCQWCAGTFSLAGPFDMFLARHANEVAYVRRFHALLKKYLEKSTEEEGLDWLSFCCFEAPYDKV